MRHATERRRTRSRGLALAASGLLAACGDAPPARTAVIVAFAADNPEPGATVIGHRLDGTVLEQVAADAVGRAEVGVEDGGYVTVVFPGNASALTPTFSLVTAPAPAAGAELAIHGPPRGSAPPLVVGVLQLSGPALAGATYFDIELGCATVRRTALPATIDVGSCSLGTDNELDVLVRGYHDTGGDPPAPVLDGYAAGRATMANGVATLALPAWRTAGTPVQVTLDGVAPTLTWTLHVDGIAFITEDVPTPAQLPSGLAIDAATVVASIPGSGTAQVTTRELSGPPATIALSASDFLAPIAVSASIVQDDPLAIIWTAEAREADAVNLYASWNVTLERRVVWNAVMAPDADGIVLPDLAGELAALVNPVTVEPVDVVVRYVDSSELAGFDALLAAGIRAQEKLMASTIAPRPIDGQLRVAHAVGLR